MLNRILKSTLFALFIFTILIAGKKGQEPRLIGVYFGDGTHYEALDASDFPGFEFYKYSGPPIFRYSEEQKMMGNPNFLPGLYGELPEKMMFGPTNTSEKKYYAPHGNGTVFMLTSGLIYWQAPFGNLSGLTDPYNPDFDNAAKMYKKLLKGKAKVKPAKKQFYTKRTGYGQLETAKGAKLDKKYEKMIGQKVPGGIKVIDNLGTEKDLASITKDGPVILVFFNMNDIPTKKKYLVLDDGATKDHPVKINHRPMSNSTFEQQSEKTMMADAENAKSAMGAIGMMAMGQVKREIANFNDNLLEGDEDLLARDANLLYKNCTAGLEFVNLLRR